ncbi:WD-40 repeat-containing protein [Saccharopolyspora erythraea NRRL 2338]|uniref:WD-40 repeat n=1 Tax=Saccharopolyspora erythraea (strain ATCC 11635 / DSM 40517 / JCM 4748 / NBRC 13426 / NCIMB 8594 / NRRL 2338) TaxID=405948 RepID=A4FJ85_SACEN|nr:helix-turn-helix domain-containing protein [Saccharopolyspora erythraea]PFG97781.1 WD-40 repeat-containing protein [Saccharopolyspora erythraea NRRL 2338]QRK87924.1 PD40 domain-containing protein [Saccharopolyspora erythraea]CAM04110.1 WD-40 repeat [Saccharopolyspora erythraea NRRL 2338]
MPRPERPLDNGPLAEFAAELRRLREKAGSPRYRELAQRTHYSVSTLSEAAGGKRLPTLAVTLAYVQACGGERQEWEQRWQGVTAELAAQNKSATTSNHGCESDLECPYVGLAAFEPEDADRFFGREHVVEDLLARLRDERFVALIGASGAGKSSLLRAGVVPKLRAGGARVAVCTPTQQPLEVLAAQVARHTGESAARLHGELGEDPQALHLAVLTALADEPSGTELVLLVDQFEEIFTLCRDTEQRTRFLTQLATAAEAGHSRLRVVLGIRSDFFDRCLDRPELVPALRTPALLGAMSTEELRRAITQPAVGQGCTVEGALLAEITAQAAGQVGMLPLVSHALRETWQRRRGNTLTLVGYEATGGIRHALTQTAEQLYTGFTEAQQRRARGLLVRLVAPGEGTEDTKRRITRAELDSDADTHAVLDALARARLVTVDDDGIEITHEALIRSWSRLRQWIDTDREGLRLHRELTNATTTWQHLDHDPGALYRGAQLTITRDWVHRAEPTLARRERDFLDASIAAEQREHRARVLRTRVLHGACAGLALLLVVASVTAVSVYNRGQQTLSRQLAQQARGAQNTDPAAAIRLSVQAHDTTTLDGTATAEGRSALLSTAGHLVHHGTLPSSKSVTGMNKLAFSPDGRLLASADDQVHVWDVATRRLRTRLTAPAANRTDRPAPYGAAAFSPDGTRVAASTTLNTGRIDVWRLDAPDQPVKSLPSTAEGNDLEFSADGRLLAAAGGTRIELWDLDTGRLIEALPVENGFSVSFSPDGRTLAYSASYPVGVGLWDLAARRHLPALPESYKHFDPRFSTDGRTLATMGTDGTGPIIWDLATRTPKVRIDQDMVILDFAFSPADQSLFIANADGSIDRRDHNGSGPPVRLVPARPDQGSSSMSVSATGVIAMTSWNYGSIITLWDTNRLPTRRDSGPYPEALTFSAEGRNLLGAYKAGELTTWATEQLRRDSTPLLPGTSDATLAGFSAEGRRFVAVTGADDPRHRTITVGDVATRTPIAVVTGPDTYRAVNAQGTLLATTGPDGLHVWNVEGPAARLIHTVTDVKPDAAIAFSPDSQHLATTRVDGTFGVWDLTNGRSITLPVPDGPAGDLVPRYSPNGRILAVRTATGVALWNATTRTPLGNIPGHFGRALAFSPDSQRLALATRDNAILIRDLPSRTRWAALTGTVADTPDAISTLIWSPDGTRLAAAAGNSLTLWTTDPEQATSALCDTLARDFRDPARPLPAACTRTQPPETEPELP